MTTAQTSACDIEDAERAAWERDFERDYRDYRDYSHDRGTSINPITDQDLWRYIKYQAGGLKRSRKYWDPNLSLRENRAAFRYLDRGRHLGRAMDELAPCIGGEWPWYGIRDEADLWEWMQRTRRSESPPQPPRAPLTAAHEAAVSVIG